MANVVVSVFAVESEAYQAFAELRQVPQCDKYTVAEAALVKIENGRIMLLDGYGIDEAATNDTATGAIVGSLIGILGGPFGVLLGAVAGGAIGSAVDADDVVDNVSAIEVVADKLNDGEIAVMALVNETDNGFDAAFQKFDVTITRYDGVEIMKEVERARELEKELSKEAREKLRAERRAERREAVEGFATQHGEMVFKAVDGSSK